MSTTGLGRFLSRDPIGYVDGSSLYAGYFVPNNVDSAGEFIRVDSGAEFYNGQEISGILAYRTMEYKREDFDFEVMKALQKTIGNCAQLVVNRHFENWNRAVKERNGYVPRLFAAVGINVGTYHSYGDISFTKESKECNCHTAWQYLKKAIQAGKMIQINYSQRGFPITDVTDPNSPSVHIDPDNKAGIQYTSSGGALTTGEFAPMLWHEVIGHASEERGHHGNPDVTVIIENIGRSGYNRNLAPGESPLPLRDLNDPTILSVYHPNESPTYGPGR